MSSSARISQQFAQISPPDNRVVGTRTFPHGDGALERHFSIKEIAELWVCVRTPSERSSKMSRV